MVLYNYSFYEYCHLSDEERLEYDTLTGAASIFKEAVDIFKVGDFTELTFGVLKDVQQIICSKNGITYKDLFEAFTALTGKTENELQQMKMKDVINFRNYVIDEIKRVNLVESITLSHHTTVEEEQAGIENFNKLGIYMQFRSLTKGDVTKFEQVRNIKYNICLLELIAQKESADYNERLSEIYKRKNPN